MIGHRGAAGYEPENTLRSIACAIELGVDWIEIDVHVVEDQLILLHDPSLERSTNGCGHLNDISFAELRKLDAGKGEQIPLLSEVFALIDAQVGLNIEVKGPGLASSVKAMAEEHLFRQPDWRGKLMLSSFDHEQTEQLQARNGEWRLGVLFPGNAEDALNRAIRLGAWAIKPSLQQVNQALVRQAQTAGLKVFVYTVNEAQDIQAMQALGVDGVFSDFPDRVHSLTSKGRVEG